MLIALSERELTHFFDGPTGGLNRLRQLPGAQFIDPSTLRCDWIKCLAQTAPSILVTGWSTPTLPTEVGQLRYVCHVAGTVRNLIPRVLIERGLLVTNWGECAGETVAEMALLLVLSSLRRSHFYAHRMHGQKGWSQYPVGAKSLFDRRIGIHGFGNVARKLIPLFLPFRPTIAIFTTGVPKEDFIRNGVSQSSSLEELFSQSDVIVEAEALTPATQGIVSERLLRRMPIGATFVNVGRGKVVDEEALAEIAAEGRIRLALDVYENEPLTEDSPLRAMQDAVLFPHLGGPTEDRSYLCGDLALQNLECFLRGETPAAVITTDIYDRST